jgi:hypothetical protein
MRLYNDEMIASINKLRQAKIGLAEASFYKYQIECAWSEGKESFDRDRYKKSIKRNCIQYYLSKLDFGEKQEVSE